MSEFLAMGGYATFVWPSYAAAALILIGLAAASWRARRRALAALEREERR